MVNLVLGSQWGDEGKGKIVDLLATSVADYVVRFHGGNNAGHTVIINNKKYKFHLLPSGVINDQVHGVIANGVIIDPEVLLGEIENIEKEGVSLTNKLSISSRCHLILPYHKALDEAYENARGNKKLGTTKRGIGPAYADKVSYNGIQMHDLLNWNNFIEKFTFQAEIKNKILRTFTVEPIDIQTELTRLKGYADKLSLYIKDTYQLLREAHRSNKDILFEGAHGILLDNDWSPYPYCTGSNVISGAIHAGSGISSKKLDAVWAVVKAYTSRVGEGPLPTEMQENEANAIRELGQEYGTTTGRPRRIGWIDLVQLAFATEIAEATHLAITKIDVLSTLSEIKICVGYEYKGRRIPYSACSAKELFAVKPIYETLPGWNQDITQYTRYQDLPTACKKYVEFVEEFTGVPINIVSTGPQRHETLIRE